MSVIVLILKIIGIVLLSVLALILLVLLLALGVPLRYRILGTAEEQMSLQVKVTWLLHLVTWTASYADGELETVLRICGIRREKKQESETEGELEEEGAAGGGSDMGAESGESTAWERPQSTEMAVVQDAKTAVVQAGETKAAGEGRSRRRVFGIGERLRTYFTGFRRSLFRIKQILLQLFTKASALRAMLADEANHTTIAGILGEIGYLLRHFRFRRVGADVDFALGDPAATGQALGVVSVLPFLYRYQCRVAPDFEAEEAYVRGSVQILGWARGVHVVISLIRLWRKREVRGLAKKVFHR